LKKIDKRLVAALLAPGLLLALFGLGGGGMLWATLDEPQRAAGRGAGIARHAAGDGGLGLWALCAWALNGLFQRHWRTGTAAGAGARASTAMLQHEIAPLAAQRCKAWRRASTSW
jgi:hypothetical protein